jgi:uncharacterized membrane protein YfcA
MITDPVFYVLAVAAVILIGLSKGGFGGALALLGVPMVALAIPPVQAAAIFLPILVVMDLAGLYAWRGIYDKRTLVIMLPGALIGIAVGWANRSLRKRQPHTAHRRHPCPGFRGAMVVQRPRAPHSHAA